MMSRFRAAELVGKLARCEDSFAFYVRGHEGIIVELVEQIG